MIIDHNAQITTLYSVMIEELYKLRVKFTNNQTQNSAINLSIILHSACWTESVLENKLLMVLKHYREGYNNIHIEDFVTRKTLNRYYERLEKHFDSSIRKTSGIEKFDNMFEILLGKSFSKDERIKAKLESIKVLFQFRNMIAHGREIHAVERSISDDKSDLTETFRGGYKKVEDYLIKKKFIDEKFIESKNLDMYFSDGVADHFFICAKSFIECIDEFIQGCFDNENTDFFDDFMKIYNEKTGNNYTFEEFLKKESFELKQDGETVIKVNNGQIEILRKDLFKEFNNTEMKNNENEEC